MKKLYMSVLGDHLYLNSLFVIMGTMVLALFGFVFWVIIARIFSPEEVGIATALISTSVLVAGFGDLGLTISLIRYLPKSENRSVLINSSLIAVSLATAIAAIIFLLGIKLFSPKLEFLISNPIYFVSFIIFAIFISWNTLLESIFKAYRASKNILLKNLILSICKLLLPLVLLSFGSYGIFSSASIGMVIACLAGLLIIHIKYSYQPKLEIDLPLVKRLAKFSGANYLAGFFYQAPILILPLIVINFLSAKSAAYYYIDNTILNLLIIIPIAITQTLLAEGSYDEQRLANHIRKAGLAIAALMVPAVLVSVFFGQIILHFFGKDYATEAFQLLQLMSISTIFLSFSLMGSAVLRVKHKIKQLVLTNLIGAILVLSSCFLLLSHQLVGLGIGWLIGEFLMSLLFLPVIIGEMDRK
jgi:O-antigen/teichoic acid export membrane protein